MHLTPFTEYSPPSWDEFFMRHVYLTASKSKDPSSKIGAVLVKDKRIISEGYNGLPRGVNDNLGEIRNVRPEKYHWYEHGERNAIYNCAREGISTLDSVMYTNGLPCTDCARAVIQAGVYRVYIHKAWGDAEKIVRGESYWKGHNERTNAMFAEADVEVISLDIDLGMDAYIDGKKFRV